MVRTFVPHNFANATTGTGFELTRTDFLRLFAIGREVHINLSPEDSVYQMDIGFTDLENAQSWHLPDIPFEGPSIWMIIDPTTTPHSSLFPDATHALLSTNDQIADGTVYVYYNFAETTLVLLGEAVEPPNAQPLETYRYDYPLSLFPMDINMGFMTENDRLYEDFDARLIHEVGMHGFGTFILDDQETVEVGAFIDDLVIRDLNEPDPNVILTFETVYSIFSKDGSLFSFFIADPPEGDSTAINGEVYIEHVDYWRVVDATTTAIEDETPSETPTWSVYPNPATDVIRFSEPTSFTLYDILGRVLREGTLMEQVNVSDLTPGLYLVRSDAGQSKMVVVR